MKRDNRKASRVSSKIEEDEENDSNFTVSKFTPILQTTIETPIIKSTSSIKLESPFRKIMKFNWETVINNYFDSFNLFEASTFDQQLYNLINSFSSYPNANEIEKFLNEKITILVNESMNTIFAQPTIFNMHSKFTNIKSNIENLNILFGSICADIPDLIISLLRSQFSDHYLTNFNELIQLVVQEFCRDQNSTSSLDILTFLTQFNFFTAKSSEQFINSFIQTLKSIVFESKTNPIECTAKIFCRVCQIFPIGDIFILESITHLYLNDVIHMDLVSFISIILPNIFEYFDDFYNFAYSTDSVDNLIDMMLPYFSSQQFSLRFAISILRIFKNFPIDTKIHLAQRLQQSIVQMNESNAVQYSEIIDKNLRKQDNDLDYDISHDVINDVSSEMLLIQNRNSFEYAHFQRMLYRSLEIPMIYDRQFAEDYKLHFGSSHSQRFESLLKDYNDSVKLVDEFRMNYDIPPFINIFVFESSNWDPKYRQFSIWPKSIQPVLEQFSVFFTEKRPKRRIQWCPALSTCALSYNEINIKCNTLVALVLFALEENIPKSVEQISSEYHIDKKEVELILETLMSKKLGKFVICQNNQYSINPEMIQKPTVSTIEIPIRPPKGFPSNAINDQNEILMSKDRQIEAAIIICIKGENGVSMNDLFQNTKQRLTFELDYQTFVDKIKALHNKHFVKYDQQKEIVIYLP